MLALILSSRILVCAFITEREIKDKKYFMIMSIQGIERKFLVRENYFKKHLKDKAVILDCDKQITDCKEYNK